MSIIYLISDSPLLYPEHPKASLVQMSDMVTASIDDLIQHCAVSVALTLCTFCLFFGTFSAFRTSSPSTS